MGFCSLADLTSNFTTRTEDSHATPEKSSLAYALLSFQGLVRLFVDHQIKQHASLLV